MSRAKLGAVLLATIALLSVATGCFAASGGKTAGASQSPEPMKPKPVVESVNAATSGMADKYYAIMDIAVKNEGADGTVIVAASITQGAQIVDNELPVYITHNGRQTVRLVFPLKWKGGDWTPSVQVRVP